MIEIPCKLRLVLNWGIVNVLPKFIVTEQGEKSKVSVISGSFEQNPQGSISSLNFFFGLVSSAGFKLNSFNFRGNWP